VHVVVGGGYDVDAAFGKAVRLKVCRYFRYLTDSIIITLIFIFYPVFILFDYNICYVFFHHLDPVAVSVDKANGEVELLLRQFLWNSQR